MNHSIFLWIFCVSIGFLQAMKVSFYGESFITMPLQEAKLSTNIRLRFRTQQKSAFIFLASGRTDYCLLKLFSGRINLIYKIGGTLFELWSPSRIEWNDLLWHDLVIQRYETNLTMRVDEYFVHKVLPLNLSELNIHFGIFIGGVGDFSETYLIGIDNFRGCISDVYYNNINILKRAKEKTSHTLSAAVNWNCSSEFDATVADSISFVQSDSFMMLQISPNKTAESWSFDIRTIEMYGTILFNQGTDLVLLEVCNGKLKLHIIKKSQVLEVVSNEIISDGQWHRITVQYNIEVAEIMVDNILTSIFMEGGNNGINLESNYYIGGVTDNIRKKSYYKNTHFNLTSFKGCMQNILWNNQAIGLMEMKVTHEISLHCNWKYPCIEKMPCILSGVCRQYGLDEFICHCDQSYCLKADYTEPYKVFSHTETQLEIEILRISPLQLIEAGTIYLSANCIEILFKAPRNILLGTTILFHVVQAPKHGSIHKLSQENGTYTNCKVFSLMDLNTDKIKYVHNGMEHFSDHITLDLQISEAEEIPEYLQGKHRFVLHVNITPVNDAPVLLIPNNNILRITQGIPKIIGNDILNVKDPDSPLNSLVYSVLNSTRPEYVNATFEVSSVAVNQFSQAEINRGLVTYHYKSVITKDLSYELLVKVSDGIETSNSLRLTISVYPLKLGIVNNTGLIMVHKSATLITPSNLSVLAHSNEESIDVRYHVKQAPLYGTIQKLRSIDSTWIAADTFTNNQIVLNQVRYLHSLDHPLQDEFKFSASFGTTHTQDFDFRISFTKLKILTLTKSEIRIIGVRKTTITNRVIAHNTIPLPTFARNIIYTILQPTTYGSIYMDGHIKQAKKMDSFTQYDIDRELIKYSTHRTSYSNFTDRLDFKVSVSECEDIYGNISIIFISDKPNKERLAYQTKAILKVREGEEVLLSKKNFELLFNTFENLTFIVSQEPHYGMVCKYPLEQINNSSQERVTRFNLEQLYLGDIYYCHDNSETETDQFQVLIISDENTDFQYVSTVTAEIILINDNVPYPSHAFTLHVVNGSTKTITESNLRYLDDDIKTKSSDIQYVHVSCFNGKFYKNRQPTDRFTQEDINNRLIMFKHVGPTLGTATYIVTDGLHEVSGSLEIQASNPFLTVPPRNASIVQEGKCFVLGLTDMSVRTNLDIRLDTLIYTILKPASYGTLKLMETNSTNLTKTSSNSISGFTQLDIEKGNIVYCNLEVASMDKLSYRVSLENITTESEILIRIYPAAYWEPLKVKNNQTLYVEESTSVLITKEILEVVHPNISPGDITYLVTTSPLHGYLEIQSMMSEDEYNCKVFDQSTINSDKIFYIQAGVNQSTDFFVFDVTNGITWLRNLVLNIIIIPENIYIDTRPLLVTEGSTTTLNASLMQSHTEYYKSKIFEYKVLRQPSYGSIVVGKSKVTRFTQKQLESSVVQYIHDGSENSTDYSELIAVARNKESLPFILPVNVIPVNDEAPVIVTNTGLQVWNGGKCIIKNSDIMARDQDSAPENLTFFMKHITGGYVADFKNLNKNLIKFTQQQINDEEIYFIHHANAKLSEISFMVTDGLFNTTDHTLHITSNPVILKKLHTEKLHVFPLTKKQILPEQLHFKCSDTTRSIKYNITFPPQLGRVVYEYIGSEHAQEITEFNQSDIDNGRVLYEHTAAMSELKVNDSFFFDVYAENSNRLIDQQIYIEISVSSGGLLRFLPISKIFIDEGGSAPIKLDFSKMLEYLKTRAGMRDPELYIEVHRSQYGTISLINNENADKVFHPEDFMMQKLYYFHDHSDTLNDIIKMSIFLAQGDILLCNLSIPVTIKPINDQPFVLITKSPHITVIEGENVTITRENLFTKDLDSKPEDIIYEIISGPTLGLLAKLSQNGESRDLLAYGNQFSQADIDNRRITYIHYGKPRSTTFYFKVSDGKFKPAYEIFNINVQPIYIKCKNEANMVKLQQGAKTVFLEMMHISINTNAIERRLLYNITNSPLRGIILFNHQPTLHFNQSQLENRAITYMQTDMTRANDTFQVYVYVAETTYGTTCEIKVTVEPLIKINSLSLPEGSKMRLIADILPEEFVINKLNKYNPKIYIVILPKIGTIRKIIRNSGEIESLNDKDVNVFTFKELRSGIVYYVADKLPNGVQVSHDSFRYSVLIKTLQPAYSEASIEVQSISKRFNDSHNVVDLHPSQSSTLYYVIIVCALFVLVLFILIILLILRYRFKNKKNDVKKESPPILPRPPDFILLNNNRIYSPSESESIPATSSSTPLPCLSNIPQCKITPMGNPLTELQDYNLDDGINDLEETQEDVSHQYQYPNVEHDDWSSSCEVPNEVDYQSVQGSHQTTNPLLRRNQYWV